MILVQRIQAVVNRVIKVVVRVGSRVFGAAGGGFAAAVEYLTPCPAWWGDDYGREDIESSPALFPVVGLIIGLVVGLCIWLLGWLVPPAVLGILGVLGLLKSTGGQGFAGLADLASRLFKSRLREKVNQPLSRQGLLAGGTFLAFGALVAKAVMLGTLSSWQCARTLVLIAVAGRTCMVLAMSLAECREEEGALEQVFWDKTSAEMVVVSLAIWGAVGVVLLWTVGLFAFVGAVAYTVVYTFYLRKVSGGLDARSLLALSELCELFTLLIVVVGYS